MGNSHKNFYLQQFQQGQFEEISYYFESNNEAAIVDPTNDAEIYINFAKSRKKQLKYILITHTHLNFPKTHSQIAEQVNDIKILIGQNPQNIQDGFEIIYDQDQYNIGQITIEALYTPGHTLDSTCYFLKQDEKYFGVFTGDTLLYNDAGRIDLQQNSQLEFNERVKLLFSSLKKIKKYPNDIVVFPGHKTLKNQTLFLNLQNLQKINKIYNIQKIEEFTNHYCLQIKPELSENDFSGSLWKSLKYKDIKELILNQDILIIDTRSQKDFEKLHFKGSINIPIQYKFIKIFSYFKLKTNQYVFVVNSQKLEKLEKFVKMLNIQNICGHIDGQIDKYNSYCVPTQTKNYQDFINNYISSQDLFLNIQQKNDLNSIKDMKCINIEFKKVFLQFKQRSISQQNIYIVGSNVIEKQVTASYFEFLEFNSVILKDTLGFNIKQLFIHQNFFIQVQYQ